MANRADDLVVRVKDIPTLPSVVMQVNRVLEDEGASLGGVISIIEKDPPVTTKVLRLANSSYYGMSRQVRTVKEAILILGLNTIRSIAVAVSVGKLFREDLNGVLNMKDLWAHSLRCAVASKALTRHKGAGLAEEGFICGLVHDIGKVILAMNLPDEMKAVAEKTREGEGRLWWEEEREVLGFTHAEVGALIAGRWNFPEVYCDAIECHHWPDQGGENGGQADSLLAYALFAGDSVAKTDAVNGSDPQDFLDPAILEKLGIEEAARRDLLAKIQEDFESLKSDWELE